MHDARVVVIGGGFAGVSAAAALRARGLTVTLLEARGVLGGRARSDTIDALTFDVGAQLITASYERTRHLLAAPGASAPLRVVPGRDAYVRERARLPIQFGSVRSLLGFSALDAREKMRLSTSLLLLLARQHDALDADAARLPPHLDAEAARTYVAERVSPRAADVIVEPMLGGFYALRGAETSLAFVLSAGRYGSGGDVLAPVVGWSHALAGALRGATAVHDARAVALAPAGAQLEVRADDGRRWMADGVVLATGPRAACALLSPLLGTADPLTRWLADVPLRPTWTVAFLLDTAPRRDAFGVFHDAAAAREVSACAVHGAKAAALPPARDVVLAWPTPAAAAAHAGARADALASAMLPEVETLVPEMRGHITRARVYRTDEGTPIPHPGFAADRARGRALARAVGLPVALAGDYLTMPLIEGAVASGEEAAATLADRLSPR